jgi:phosphoribosylanthranilate isomerase
MTWIKICGITNLDDALAAADAGANAIGFVFYERSPRHITPEEAQAIASKMTPKVEKIGVFVNPSVECVRETAKLVGLTAVQLHGNEDKQFSQTLFKALSNGGASRPTIFRSFPAQIFDKPAHQSVGWDPVAVGLVEPDEAYTGKRVQKIHVAQNGDLFLETHGFRPGVVSGVLLDSSTATSLGGTGRTFDWERVQPWAGIINSISKLVVAGGLHPRNVQDAIHILRPWGVDVSTGVEHVPRKKDPGKIHAFVEAVRTMDESN